ARDGPRGRSGARCGCPGGPPADRALAGEPRPRRGRRLPQGQRSAARRGARQAGADRGAALPRPSVAVVRTDLRAARRARGRGTAGTPIVKRLVFRLRRVRGLGKREVAAAMRALGSAVSALARCEERVAAIDAMLAECDASAADGTARALAEGLRRGLDVARARAWRSRTAAAQQVEAARAAYAQRRAAALAIASLERGKRAAWQRAVAAAEQAELEELVRLARHRPRPAARNRDEEDAR